MELTINAFTKKCRLLQSVFREELNEPMGVGPWRTSKNRQISMIADGVVTGKNFVNEFVFGYAKQRVENKLPNETIDEYRLFNNLLSSQPMAFNLFCPLISMLERGLQNAVDSIVCAIFPDFDIDTVTGVGLEYLHTDVENYLNDKTAMDAIIRYTDHEGLPCFIAIETKYTDVLGLNSARNTAKQKALIKELGYFKTDSEEALLNGDKEISQIYRNFLLTECYRIKEPVHEAYSVVLAPAEHPTTKEEVSSLKEELKPEYQYKLHAVTLEYFVEKAIQNCPEEERTVFEWFYNRYLAFDKLA